MGFRLASRSCPAVYLRLVHALALPAPTIDQTLYIRFWVYSLPVAGLVSYVHQYGRYACFKVVLWMCRVMQILALALRALLRHTYLTPVSCLNSGENSFIKALKWKHLWHGARGKVRRGQNRRVERKSHAQRRHEDYTLFGFVSFFFFFHCCALWHVGTLSK